MLYQSREITTTTTLRKGKISQLESIGVLRHPDYPETRSIGRESSACFLNQPQSEVEQNDPIRIIFDPKISDGYKVRSSCVSDFFYQDP